MKWRPERGLNTWTHQKLLGWRECRNRSLICDKLRRVWDRGKRWQSFLSIYHLVLVLIGEFGLLFHSGEWGRSDRLVNANARRIISAVQTPSYSLTALLLQVFFFFLLHIAVYEKRTFWPMGYFLLECLCGHWEKKKIVTPPFCESGIQIL